MTGALIAGALAGYGVAVPVGAIAILVLGLSARAGVRVGAAAALGAATADGLYSLAAVAGGAALAGLIRPVATPLRFVAAVVLIGLAVRTALTAVRRHPATAGAARAATGLGTPTRAYLAVLGLTALNPATILYFGALVLGRQSADGFGAGASLLFVVGVFLASASWQLVLVAGGSLLGRILAGPQGRLATALLSSVVIAGLAVSLLVPG